MISLNFVDQNTGVAETLLTAITPNSVTLFSILSQCYTLWDDS